jgi:molybdopterin adenylyltransferase
MMDAKVDVSKFKVAVITLSDRAYSGEREDLSGPAIMNYLKERGYSQIEYVLIADDGAKLESELVRLSDLEKVDLILTTGGTGFAARDITPEVTLSVATKNAPGISEAIRAYSLTKTPHAMLSRGASVIRNSTLIINLPGSPKAVRESLDVIIEALPHGLGLLRGEKLDK